MKKFGSFVSQSMSGKNRQLLADEPVECDEPVEVQDLRKFTYRFRGIYRRIYLNEWKHQNQKMSICNMSDLGSLGID